MTYIIFNKLHYKREKRNKKMHSKSLTPTPRPKLNIIFTGLSIILNCKYSTFINQFYVKATIYLIENQAFLFSITQAFLHIVIHIPLSTPLFQALIMSIGECNPTLISDYRSDHGASCQSKHMDVHQSLIREKCLSRVKLLLSGMVYLMPVPQFLIKRMAFFYN